MSAAMQAIEQRTEMLAVGIVVRFCNYCGCLIGDQKRARKSPYCSIEHRRLAANEKRELRATEGPCRICGRTKRSRVKQAAKVAEKGCATAAQGVA